MKLLLFSLKKTLRTPIYWIFLLGLLLLPPLFYQVGRQTAPPPAAYFLADAADPDGVLLAGHLADAGFLSYPSEESLRRDISLGRLEGGVVIPADLTARLSRGEYKESLCFITSSTALLPDLWQNHTAAALLAVYSPYISADILKEADISEAEMKAAYQEMMTTGQLFHFEISTRDGILVPDVMRSRRFFLGAIGLLLFLASYFCIAAPLGESVEEMALRLGKGRAYRSLYVPGMLLRGLGLLVAGGLHGGGAERVAAVWHEQPDRGAQSRRHEPHHVRPSGRTEVPRPPGREHFSRDEGRSGARRVGPFLMGDLLEGGIIHARQTRTFEG